jgi:hypothetical protein
MNTKEMDANSAWHTVKADSGAERIAEAWAT